MPDRIFFLRRPRCGKDLEKAFYWTERAANYGDRDGQSNLAWFYEEGVFVEVDIEKAKHWYKLSAQQGQTISIEKCKEYDIRI